MAFPTEAAITPTSIGMVRVLLESEPDGEGGVVQRALYEFDVLDGNGERITRRRGNLVPHLTAQEITAAQTFVANRRAQAEATLPS